MSAVSKDLRELARAFVDLAKAEDVAPQALHDLHIAGDIFLTNPVLLRDLAETTIPLEKRQKALEKGFAKDVHVYVLNALLALQRRDSLDELARFIQIAEAFGQRLAQHERVQVTSASALTTDERREIEKLLKKKVRGTYDLEEHVDASLIGGLIVTIGDMQIDASTRGNIQRLAHSLTA